MPVLENTSQKFIVTLKKVKEVRCNLAQITTENIETKRPLVFDAWDNKYEYIKRKVKLGDVLIIDCVDYVWPGSGNRTKRIEKVSNYSSCYTDDVIITNANNIRGKAEKYQNCFCGQSERDQLVTYFYLTKGSWLNKYVVKGRHCRIAGTEIKSPDKHKRVMVENIYWI